MINLWVAFFTGFTTGGLSCMAVQGGLLASSLASQIERDISVLPNKQKNNKHSLKIAFPIFLFLITKLLMYTLLGALLGGLGKVLQITPAAQAILQFLIAIFMIGNALRMLNVHPIFRYFVIEPPSSVTRFIRKKSKNSKTWFAPMFMGALTVLIPCGVTQTVMAAAIASGSPLNGAALMFAFTLGTSPIFFALSYFATRLGALTEKYFVRIVAVTLIILGVLAFDTGLNLLGSRVSITRLVDNLSNAGQTLQAPLLLNDQKESSPNRSEIILNVVNDGYEPKTLHAPADLPIRLHLVTNDTRSCSRAFLIPGIDFQILLPSTGTEIVEIPAQPKGTVLPFTCSMGMYTGEIVFDL